MEGLVIGLVYALAAVSVCIWVAVYRVWRSDGSILAYEPRRPVPWGPIGLIIAGLIFFLAALSGIAPAEDSPQPPRSAAIQGILLDVLVKSLVAGFVLAWIVMSHRATREDLGLPKTLSEASSDSLLGALASLAALAPVYFLLNVLVRIFGERPQNPLLKRILEDPSGAMLAAAFVSAVIVAPIFEEFVYRLLVQGWLERILMPPRAFIGGKSRFGGTIDTGPEDVVAEDAGVEPEPPEFAEGDSGQERLPEGFGEGRQDGKTFWLPILISSLLFSAAHFGFEYGYSPIPLFLLAMVLGYLYQRTHRILPCIVAHMVFNGISITMLWLQIPESR